MSDADAKLDDAFQRAKARNPVLPGPTPLAVALPDEFGATRGGECSCGKPFMQTRMVKGWLPLRCGACMDAADDAKGIAQDEARQAVKAMAIDVPPRYEFVTLESFQHHGNADAKAKQARVLQLARRYLADWPGVADAIVMRGGPGTGKGHVSWSLAKVIARSYGVRVVVVKLPDLIRDLRDAWRRESDASESQRLRRYRDAGLLVIDEVSRHAFYGESYRHLYDVLDNRIEYLRPTLITTNATGEELMEILGPALTSRVAGSVGGLWEFGDADYRILARKERDAA